MCWNSAPELEMRTKNSERVETEERENSGPLPVLKWSDKRKNAIMILTYHGDYAKKWKKRKLLFQF